MVVDNNGTPSCILPITQVITKRNTSGESITMDLVAFARVSHAHSFGRCMSDGPSGIRFSAVYGRYQLAEHTVLAGFQFDPGGYLF